MQRAPLGTTGLQVSRLGFGCSSFWARPAFPERQAIALVHAALDAGITFFDTGSSYADGGAERRLGAALRQKSSVDAIVATKAGTRVAGRRAYKDFSPASVRESVERSLRNLGLDALPLLHLHGPKPADLTDALLETLERLRQEGLVRHFGVNSARPELQRAVRETPLFETAMFDYNLLHAQRRRDVAELVAAGKAVLGATPLAQMLFSAGIFKPRGAADFSYLARALASRRADLRRARAFRFADRVEGWTGAEVALAWVLSNPQVSVAIVGTTSQERLRQNVATCARKLPPEVSARIEAAP